MLGKMYEYGYGVERNLEKASKYYERACYELEYGLGCAFLNSSGSLNIIDNPIVRNLLEKLY